MATTERTYKHINTSLYSIRLCLHVWKSVSRQSATEGFRKWQAADDDYDDDKDADNKHDNDADYDAVDDSDDDDDDCESLWQWIIQI